MYTIYVCPVMNSIHTIDKHEEYQFIETMDCGSGVLSYKMPKEG